MIDCTEGNYNRKDNYAFFLHSIMSCLQTPGWKTLHGLLQVLRGRTTHR